MLRLRLLLVRLVRLVQVRRRLVLLRRVLALLALLVLALWVLVLGRLVLLVRARACLVRVLPELPQERVRLVACLRLKALRLRVLVLVAAQLRPECWPHKRLAWVLVRSAGVAHKPECKAG